MRALGLLALGLPLSHVEYLTGIKSETLRKDVLSLPSDPKRWFETEQQLARLGLVDSELNWLMRVGLSSGKTNRGSPDLRASFRCDLAALKARIERLIGKKILVGASRQGLCLCCKSDFADFVRRIRAVPVGTFAKVNPLSQTELEVLEQLWKPNARSHLLAALDSAEIEVNPATGKLLRKLAVRHLASGLEMDVGRFQAVAIGLVRKLDRTRRNPINARAASS
jgi:hypothetical protein